MSTEAAAPKTVVLEAHARRVQITNVPRTATRRDVRMAFAKAFGPVERVYLKSRNARDPTEHTGNGFVVFAADEACQAATVAGSTAVSMKRVNISPHVQQDGHKRAANAMRDLPTTGASLALCEDLVAQFGEPRNPSERALVMSVWAKAGQWDRVESTWQTLEQGELDDKTLGVHMWCCAQAGRAESVLTTLRETVPARGLTVTKTMFLQALKACLIAGEGNSLSQLLRDDLPALGLQLKVRDWNSLIYSLFDSRKPAAALRLIDEVMPEAQVEPNATTTKARVVALTNMHRHGDALDFFTETVSAGGFVPKADLVETVAKSAAATGRAGPLVLAMTKTNDSIPPSVWTRAEQLCKERADADAAVKLLRLVLRKDSPAQQSDVATLLKLCAHFERIDDLIRTVDEAWAAQGGLPVAVEREAALLLSKAGRVDQLRAWHERNLPRKTIVSAVLMDHFAAEGKPEEALLLFDQMSRANGVAHSDQTVKRAISCAPDVATTLRVLDVAVAGRVELQPGTVARGVHKCREAGDWRSALAICERYLPKLRVTLSAGPAQAMLTALFDAEANEPDEVAPVLARVAEIIKAKPHVARRTAKWIQEEYRERACALLLDVEPRPNEPAEAVAEKEK